MGLDTLRVGDVRRRGQFYGPAEQRPIGGGCTQRNKRVTA